MALNGCYNPLFEPYRSGTECYIDSAACTKGEYFLYHQYSSSHIFRNPSLSSRAMNMVILRPLDGMVLLLYLARRKLLQWGYVELAANGWFLIGVR